MSSASSASTALYFSRPWNDFWLSVWYSDAQHRAHDAQGGVEEQTCGMSIQKRQRKQRSWYFGGNLVLVMDLGCLFSTQCRSKTESTGWTLKNASSPKQINPKQWSDLQAQPSWNRPTFITHIWCIIFVNTEIFSWFPSRMTETINPLLKIDFLLTVSQKHIRNLANTLSSPSSLAA